MEIDQYSPKQKTRKNINLFKFVLVGHEVKHTNKKGLKSSYIDIARASIKIGIWYNLEV